MHRDRILTSLVAGPLLFILLWWGGRGLFGALVIAGSLLCLYEYFRIAFSGRTTVLIFGLVTGSLPVVAAVWAGTSAIILPSLAFSLLLSGLYFIFTFKKWETAAQNLFLFYAGAAYVGFCLAHIWLLRTLPNGKAWVLFLLLVIFSGDAAAYYVGRAVGKHKLRPDVSSGKTVEGAVGGLAANLLAGLIAWFLLFNHFEPRLLLPAAVIIGIVGQIGDLVESIVKRSFGVKDSGQILPGHGGVFDRVDAVMLAAPFLYWIIYFGYGEGWLIR